jgi:hypothetical protein
MQHHLQSVYRIWVDKVVKSPLVKTTEGGGYDITDTEFDDRAREYFEKGEAKLGGKAASCLMLLCTIIRRQRAA